MILIANRLRYLVIASELQGRAASGLCGIRPDAM